jgi:hypothetical protein
MLPGATQWGKGRPFQTNPRRAEARPCKADSKVCGIGLCACQPEIVFRAFGSTKGRSEGFVAEQIGFRTGAHGTVGLYVAMANRHIKSISDRNHLAALKDEAIEYAAKIPSALWGTVEVRPVWGM